jgi:hypothetical protein
MKSFSIGASAFFAVVLACQSAQAQYGQCGQCNSHTMFEKCCNGYRANVMWPRQFVPAARRPIRETYAAMINNGWRRQNLLGDYHFDPETNELTRAGEMKVQWVLTQAPINRRDVYVQRAATGSETATRIAAVHGYGSQMNPAVEHVNVNDTHIVAEGHSATTVDNMFIGFHANQPPPVLPVNVGNSNE